MRVRVVPKSGFCFGVEHAIELAQEMLAAGRQVYCLGHLIHNNRVVQQLVDAGLHVVEQLDEVPPPQTGSPPPTVLIRSHGCRPEVVQAVRDRGLELADATCVLVKRVQKLAAELAAEGYQVIIVGDPNHPEVQGVLGYAPSAVVVTTENDLDAVPRQGRLAVLSQTTHSSEDFSRIVGLLAGQPYQEMKVVNTICRETMRRQASAIEACQEVDVMFVLGSHHSANTRELAELCRRQGAQTYHLESWQEFKPQYIAGSSVAGITAGASTPAWIIREFRENLERL